MKDLKSNLNLAGTLFPAARTASANGTGVDLQGYQGAMAALTTGVITDGTHTVALEESDDNSVFTAVAAADLIGAFTALTTAASDDNSVQRVGYIGNKRYIRAAVTVAGATTGGIYGVTIVRGAAALAPLA